MNNIGSQEMYVLRISGEEFSNTTRLPSTKSYVRGDTG